MNLLHETIEDLKANGKTPQDVDFVLAGDYYTDWGGFAAHADSEYDNGYGGEEVLSRIRVVGNGWWLERHEYDGSEWWEYKMLPTKDGKQKVDGFNPFYGR